MKEKREHSKNMIKTERKDRPETDSDASAESDKPYDGIATYPERRKG